MSTTLSQKLSWRFFFFAVGLLATVQINAQTNIVRESRINQFRPGRSIKLDPSHLIFAYAPGMVVGYEAPLKGSWNWALEFGKAYRSRNANDIRFFGGTKLRANFRKYLMLDNDKARKTRYITFGMFYDNHRFLENGSPEDTYRTFDYMIKRQVVGFEVTKGFVYRLDDHLFFDPYVALRSSFTFRDHLEDAPDRFRASRGYLFTATRSEGARWRPWHVMFGFKISYLLD